MRRLYLSLGTNMGDREKNIERALELLDSQLGRHYIALSPVMETEAIGFNGGSFLNAIVVYESARKPERILEICKRIEREMGRIDPPEYDTDGKRVYHDRIIDIDILLYGRMKLETESLIIPHPQVETRPFIKELLLLLQDYSPKAF